MVLVPDASGRWEPTPAAPGLQTAPGLIVYRYGADLFYANADQFAEQVRALVDKAPEPVKWFVIDAEAIGDVDLSAAQTVRALLEELSRKGVQVLFGRVNRYLLSDMQAAPDRRSHRRGANLRLAARSARRRPRRRLVSIRGRGESARDPVGRRIGNEAVSYISCLTGGCHIWSQLRGACNDADGRANGSRRRFGPPWPRAPLPAALLHVTKNRLNWAPPDRRRQ